MLSDRSRGLHNGPRAGRIEDMREASQGRPSDPTKGQDMLRITHTPDEGTIIDGTARGDGTAEVLKGCGWRWGRSIAAWYVPQSRDRQPKSYVIERTSAALQAAGFEVEIEIEAGHRPTAAVEADLAQRREDRAEGLAAKAERRAADAKAAWAAADAAAALLPEGGEPIKIGHHSEGRHRRAIERSWTKLGQAIKADGAAASAAERAAIAGKGTDRRYNPVTVANRVERLEAEARKLRRTLDGHTRTLFTDSHGVKHVDTTAPASGKYRVRIEALLAETTDQLDYWRSVRAEQLAEGVATAFGPESVTKGDLVLAGGIWWRVTRANRKTISGESRYGTQLVPYQEIKQVKPSE